MKIYFPNSIVFRTGYDYYWFSFILKFEVQVLDPVLLLLLLWTDLRYINMWVKFQIEISWSWVYSYCVLNYFNQKYPRASNREWTRPLDIDDWVLKMTEVHRIWCLLMFINLLLKLVCSWQLSLSWIQRRNWAFWVTPVVAKQPLGKDCLISSTDIILSKVRTQIQIEIAWLCQDRVGFSLIFLFL